MFKKLKVVLSLFLALTIVGSVNANGPLLIAEKDSTVTFNIVHTNDIHGAIADDGKFLNFATWYKTFKAANPNTFLVDAGDATQGTAVVGAGNGALMVELMNEVGYDYVTLGNHEFDYGKDAVLKNIKDWKATVLASNIRDRKTGKTLGDAWRVKEVDGVRIGFFGVANTDFINKVANFSTDYIIEDPVKTAKRIVKEMEKANVDLIVCVSHLGTTEEGYNTSQQLSREVPELSLIIDGHSHTNCPTSKCLLNAGNALISSNEGQMANGIRYLKVTYNKTTKQYSMTPVQVGIAELKKLPKDANASAVYNKTYDAIKPYLNAVIGNSEIRLNGNRKAPLDSVRSSETNLGNLIADAYRENAKTDIAIINGGNIRTSVEAGDITRDNILTVQPFSNSIVVTELTGKQILAMFELSVSKYPVENGGFLHLSGGTLKFDATKAAGNRITEFTIDGKPLDVTKKYSVAIPDFLRNGGDGYTMLVGSFEVRSLQLCDSELVMDYIEKHQTINPKVEGRIVEINVK